MIARIICSMFMLCALNANAQNIKFKADISDMFPMAYSAKTGLTGFSFEMRNDSAFVHLPYIGEVYTPTLNNDGLNFDEPCKDITVNPTKKKDGRKIDFSLRHDIVSYKFSITLWDNNRMDIYMQPSNAQGCNYSGEWVPS